MSIEKEFAPYQESFELKELGFDEPCLGWYQESNYGTEKVHVDSHWKTHLSGLEDEDFLSAPTFSQAFRWFREKYSVHSSPRKYDETNWWVEWGTWTSPVFETFEEAELAWLRKLIQTIKQKS